MEKEFYEEFEDMEAGIDQKQALVEESKKVPRFVSIDTFTLPATPPRFCK